jgi:hypothetical protein
VYVVLTERLTELGEDAEPTRLYGVTSLTAPEADAERLLRLHRGHWTVENKAFWARDVVMGEDASPVATGNIVALMASLRGAVLNLLRAAGGGAVARSVRKLNGNRKAALKFLGCPERLSSHPAR